jgi:hypothetical protein
MAKFWMPFIALCTVQLIAPSVAQSQSGLSLVAAVPVWQYPAPAPIPIAPIPVAPYPDPPGVAPVSNAPDVAQPANDAAPDAEVDTTKSDDSSEPATDP